MQQTFRTEPNFGQDDADVNISVYVAIREFNVPSTTIPFTEFRIKEEVFNNDKEAVVRSIIDAVANALNGEEFSIPPAYADRRDYPINTIGDTTTQTTINNDDKQLNCNRNMKQTIRLTERELRSMVKEAVNEAVGRPRPNTTSLAESKLWNMIQEAVSVELNEMDWKTYLAAARKDWKNSNEERSQRFAHAARDSFNKEFGYDELDDELEYYGEKAHQEVGGSNFTPYGNEPSVGMNSWAPHFACMHNIYNPKDGKEGDYPYSTMKPSKRTQYAYDRAKGEVQKHADGRYKYIKGKGWQ